MTAPSNQPAPAGASLRATYRLQLTPSFTLADARKAVPYLARLGASHLYLSPIWEAAPGSTHGYDVVDHSRVREELGGLAGYYELVAEARANGLGVVLDIVPNHVGIEGGRHAWWRDVLRFGQASPFAPYFDIDWIGRPGTRPGVVVFPVLGAPFGQTLESGELRLDFDGEELVVRYWEHSFPVSPRTYVAALELPPASLFETDPEPFAQLVRLLQDLEVAERDAALALVAEFGRLVQANPPVAAWLERALTAANGQQGDPASFDRLEALLSAQHYRLAYWRVSSEEINYRRFFDINTLAGVRVEYDPAFEASHALVARLCAEGLVDGLRVDHVDGLNDPADYLRRLTVVACGTREVPVWVEKILGEDEQLPAWPVAGTTGYEFLGATARLFLDRAGLAQLGRTYDEFTGVPHDFDEIAFEARREIADRAFDGEVTGLALELHRIGEQHRHYRDNTVRSLRDALVSLLASLPVYRLYMGGEESRPEDREVLLGAAQAALERDPGVTPQAMEQLTSVLLDTTGELPPAEVVRRRAFVRRFQQLSSPVMAKGMEDTAFFRYSRLLAQNEVGASPAAPTLAPSVAHEWFARRAERWPLALSATTTHDTKRSEDARARLMVLSEMPGDWRREVRRWARTNRRWKTKDAGGALRPGAETEYYLYQTLVASWPGAASAGYLERIQEHMRKASREAKLETSWVEPDERWERALETFVARVLDPARAPRFHAWLSSFVERLLPAARINTLAMVALKCLAPGVPDFYQGSERELLTLTDPDNRVPVDFDALAAELDAGGCRRSPSGANEKLWLTARLLDLRHRYPGALAGGYEPLEFGGELAGRLFGFIREGGGQALAVVLPRLVAASLDETGNLPGPALRNTTAGLPVGSWRSALGGEAEPATLEALAAFPVAVFVREEARS